MEIIRKIRFRSDKQNSGEIQEATINFGEEKDVRAFCYPYENPEKDEFEHYLSLYAMELMLKQGFFHVYLVEFLKVEKF